MNNKKDEIYNSITKKQLWLLFVAGGLIGSIIFIVCYGVSVLNVTNDSWLLSGEDLMQHYVGWKAYRSSEWHFPIGLTEGLYYPHTTCVIFTDSIPLFAIFFKLFSPILPETFQYFGIWGITTFFLMGGVSAVIIRKGVKNLWLCIGGSVFFSYSPYVFQRMYGHTALAGNWIILLAIAIWIYKPYFNNFKRKLIAWGTLLIIGSLVHIYYIPMIMIFMIFSCFEDLLKNQGWKMDLLMGIIVIIADLLVLYCVGAFSATSSMDAEGLGLYSSNINSLWNSMGISRLFRQRPYNQGQNEGFGYLGLGILILLAITAVIFVFSLYRSIKAGKEKNRESRFWKRYAFQISMILSWIAIFILALSPVITYGERVILEINYPNKIIKLLSVFRASGRFIWCAGYILMFMAIMEVGKKLRPVAAGVIIGATVLVQLIDLSPFACSRKSITENYQKRENLTSEQWEEIADNKSHLVFIPFNTVWTQKGVDMVYEFANFAIDHHMTVNYYISARTDNSRIIADENEIKQQLSNGIIDNNTIYILESQSMGIDWGLDMRMIDGFAVGTKK